jgi:hypothetical protein
MAISGGAGLEEMEQVLLPPMEGDEGRGAEEVGAVHIKPEVIYAISLLLCMNEVRSIDC